MDNLSVSDEYYDKKYEDMQVRLDKLYDEIEKIETFIEAVETRLYNIKQEKISGDNVYQFLLFFDNLYDRFTDMEKKIFMKSFLLLIRRAKRYLNRVRREKTYESNCFVVYV